MGENTQGNNLLCVLCSCWWATTEVAQTPLFLPSCSYPRPPPDVNYIFQIFYGSFSDDRFGVSTLLFRDKLLNSL